MKNSFLKVIPTTLKSVFVDTSEDQGGLNILDVDVAGNMKQEERKAKRKQVQIEFVKKSALASVALVSILSNKKHLNSLKNICLKNVESLFNNSHIENSKVSMIKMGIQSAVNVYDVASAVTLDQVSSKIAKDILVNSLELCANVTGYKVQDILNLRFDNDMLQAPESVIVDYHKGTKNISEISMKMNNTHTLTYKEMVIPTINNRIMIAYANWAYGDAPKSLNLNIKDVRTLLTNIVNVNKSYEDKIEILADILSERIEDIELIPVVDSSGNTILSRN